ncbi:MAG: 4'-phosphopantetheinyl transferase family protein [Pseudomonadales bacterium]
MSKPLAVLPIEALFPQASDLSVVSVLGPIDDYSDELTPSERRSIKHAVAKRQREFAAGRIFARWAMQALGVPPTSLPLTLRKGPRWPAGMTGSISHSPKLAWVVAANTQHLLGVGVDLEQCERVKPELHERLFTTTERQQIGTDKALAASLFCAKEAVYKATQPTAGRYIGFLEVEVLLDVSTGIFSMRYLGDHEPSALMEQGRGFVCTRDEHALALFTIPPASEDLSQTQQTRKV